MEGYFPTTAGDDPVAFASEHSTTDRPVARSRDSLFLLARLTLGVPGEAHDVRVRNLSAGGLMAEYDGRVSIGDPIKIDLRGIGEIGGRIAWSAEGRIGVALDEPIDPKRARKPVGARSIRR